jgi:hypothetical protein
MKDEKLKMRNLHVFFSFLLYIKIVRTKDLYMRIGSMKDSKTKEEESTHLTWNVCQVRLREPIHLCTYVCEEGGDREGVDTESPSLLSYTLRYVSLAELGNVCQVGL